MVLVIISTVVFLVIPIILAALVKGGSIDYKDSE